MTTTIPPCTATAVTPPALAGANYCNAGYGLFLNQATGKFIIAGTQGATACTGDLGLFFDCATGEYFVRHSHFKSTYPDARLDYNGSTVSFGASGNFRTLPNMIIQDQLVTNTTCETIEVMARMDVTVGVALAGSTEVLIWSPQILVNGAVHVTGAQQDYGRTSGAYRRSYYGYNYQLPPLAAGASYTIGIGVPWTNSAPGTAFSFFDQMFASLRIWSGTQ